MAIVVGGGKKWGKLNAVELEQFYYCCRVYFGRK